MAAASARTPDARRRSARRSKASDGTTGAGRERPGVEREGSACSADRLGESGAGERRRLDRLADLVLGDGELGVRPRFIRARPQLVPHQRLDRLREGLQPIDVGPSGQHGFVRRKDADERICRGGSRIELGQRGLRAGERGLSAGSLVVGLAHAEVDSLP
jgi:hypothetical protein